MLSLVITLLVTAICFTVALADTEILGRVTFNEHEIEEKARRVDLDDPMRVFSHVFSHLDDEVMVYPTENYYYFGLYANGRKYSGNFRLHPKTRDKGQVDFAYFDTSDPNWKRHQVLGEKDGVIVRKVDELTYAIRYSERSVTFHLNPIGQGSADVSIRSSGEEHIGRSVDESGLVLILAFDYRANGFLWILDRNQMMDVPLVQLSPTLAVHVPSGFVFFRFPGTERYVLAAVDRWHVVRNTYFDGPFDQLPDNWLDDTSFRVMAERAMPSIKGRINARGEYNNSEMRVAIQPYMHYHFLGDVLAREAACWQLGMPSSALFIRCLIASDR